MVGSELKEDRRALYSVMKATLSKDGSTYRVSSTPMVASILRLYSSHAAESCWALLILFMSAAIRSDT